MAVKPISHGLSFPPLTSSNRISPPGGSVRGSRFQLSQVQSPLPGGRRFDPSPEGSLSRLCGPAGLVAGRIPGAFRQGGFRLSGQKRSHGALGAFLREVESGRVRPFR